jgi:hypothetical protein
MTHHRVETYYLLHLSEIYLSNCCVRRIIFYLFQWTFKCYIVHKLRKNYFLKVNCDAVRTWIIAEECKIECIISYAYTVNLLWWRTLRKSVTSELMYNVEDVYKNTFYGKRRTLTSITNTSQKSECTYSVLFENFTWTYYRYYYLFN